MSETNPATGRIRTLVEDLDRRTAALYVALYGGALLWIIPYVYMVTSSFQTNDQLLAPNQHWIPNPVTLHWFDVIFNDTMIIQWTINTLIIALAGSIMVMLIDSLAAFSLTRLEWPGQKLALSVILASFMVPGVVNLIPVYTILSDFGLINTYAGVILPGAANAFGVFMLVQFFKDIPDELGEAAQLDGFSTLQRFTRIIVPLRLPAITSLGLFWFIWSWNSFVWPLIILQKSSKFPLAIGLVTLKGNHAYEPGLTMASALIAALPLFILFVALQDYLVKAVAMQGTVR